MPQQHENANENAPAALAEASPEDHIVTSTWDLTAGAGEQLLAVLRLQARDVLREFESRGAKKGDTHSRAEGWGGPAWRNHDEAEQAVTRADVALREVERVNEKITRHLRWLRDRAAAVAGEPPC